MRFCRNHPCFGWLSLEPQDYRFVYNKLIEMRDADLKAGDNSSGFPSGFEDWALSHLEELAKQQTYKKRIADHLDQMDTGYMELASGTQKNLLDATVPKKTKSEA